MVLTDRACEKNGNQRVPTSHLKGWCGGVLLGEKCQRSVVRITSRSTTPCLICWGHNCLSDRVRSAVRPMGRSRFVASTPNHLVHARPLATSERKCGASKGAVPKGARLERRTQAAGCRAGRPERCPTRSRMLGECSIRELVASFEEAHLPLQPTARWVTRIAAIVAWAC